MCLCLCVCVSGLSYSTEFRPNWSVVNSVNVVGICGIYVAFDGHVFVIGTNKARFQFVIFLFDLYMH